MVMICWLIVFLFLFFNSYIFFTTLARRPGELTAADNVEMEVADGFWVGLGGVSRFNASVDLTH